VSDDQPDRANEQRKTMNFARRSYGLARSLLSYRARKISVPNPPIKLWIETSLACNLKCVMCPNKELPGADKGNMDLKLYKKIVSEAAGFVGDVNIHHRGEPLANPRLGEMIRYAVDAGLAVRFHTNATLMDEERAREIVDARPDWVSISFDGFQKEIYEEVRKGANFEQTVSNILGFLRARQQAGTHKPYISIERIDFRRYREQAHPQQIERLASEFRVAGLDEIVVKQEFNWTTLDSPERGPSSEYTVCTFPWYAMVICWDGTVTPCPQDYLAHMVLGNVKDKSIREIWNDEQYRELRWKQVNAIETLPLCRKCDRLNRKQMAGLPFQYMIPFLMDHFVGYGRLRKMIGSFERNE
jgi:radical SAM protein with 4Fe4S-binding SPASM domain